jgi:methylated-DNA-[protein]-cysteine S-methyltransferase
VIGADGSLVGYGGGLERKKFLLELENPARAKTPVQESLFA